MLSSGFELLGLEFMRRGPLCVASTATRITQIIAEESKFPENEPRASWCFSAPDVYCTMPLRTLENVLREHDPREAGSPCAREGDGGGSDPNGDERPLLTECLLRPPHSHDDAI